MTWTPISNTVPQYAKNAGGAAASGYYLKFYAGGTTTPINMASASDGSGLLDKCQLDTNGYPLNGSGDIFIPYLDQNYKAVLYANSTDADNNTFSSAEWSVEVVISTASSNLSQQRERQLGSSASSRVFTLTGITYVPAANNLQVYRNGQKLILADDYTETSNSQVTLTFDPNNDDVFEFLTNFETSLSTLDTSAITHTESGTNYNLATYLQNRHEVSGLQVVNAGDFGATGNDATIQAAVDKAVEVGVREIYIPFSSLTLASDIDCQGRRILGNDTTIPNSNTLINHGGLSNCTISSVKTSDRALHNTPAITSRKTKILEKVSGNQYNGYTIANNGRGYVQCHWRDDIVDGGASSIGGTSAFRIAKYRNVADIVMFNGTLVNSSGLGTSFTRTYGRGSGGTVITYQRAGASGGYLEYDVGQTPVSTLSIAAIMTTGGARTATVTAQPSGDTLGSFELEKRAINITNITQANPAQVTSADHGYKTGDEILIQAVVGMTEVNSNTYTITKVDDDNFTLDGTDSTGYTAYSSGGTSQLTAEEQVFIRLPVQALTGVVRITNNDASRNLEMAGVNAWTLEDESAEGDVDTIAYSYNTTDYTINQGANDFALKRYGDLTGGSYHGGETVNSDTFTVDGVTETLSIGGITYGKDIRHTTNVTITWPSDSATATVARIETLADGAMRQLKDFNLGALQFESVWTCMCETNYALSSVRLAEYKGSGVGSSPLHNTYGRTNAVQQDSGLTTVLTNYFTVFDNEANSNGGPYITDNSPSNVRKLYYGPVLFNKRAPGDLTAEQITVFGG